jgi:hypothetical protein
MAFKEARGNKTVEACVMPAHGGRFKGYIRLTTKRNTQIVGQTIGRGCRRPVPTAEAAMELAEAKAKRVIAL